MEENDKEQEDQDAVTRCQELVPNAPFARTNFFVSQRIKKVRFILTNVQKIGRTRDRTWITGIRIRCANHYTIQPLMEGRLAG
jgi:hypothetical protein